MGSAPRVLPSFLRTDPGIFAYRVSGSAEGLPECSARIIGTRKRSLVQGSVLFDTLYRNGRVAKESRLKRIGTQRKDSLEG